MVLTKTILLGLTMPFANGFYLEWYHECYGNAKPNHAPGSKERMLVHIRNWLGDNTTLSGPPTLRQLGGGCSVGIAPCATNTELLSQDVGLLVATQRCLPSLPDGILLFRFADQSSCLVLHDEIATASSSEAIQSAASPYVFTNVIGFLGKDECVDANDVYDSGTPCAKDQFRRHSRVTYLGMSASVDDGIDCNTCQQSVSCPILSPKGPPSPPTLPNALRGPGLPLDWVIAVAVAVPVGVLMLVGAAAKAFVRKCRGRSRRRERQPHVAMEVTKTSSGSASALDSTGVRTSGEVAVVEEASPLAPSSL
uniref:Uncharacterized protein n=1 Tax=Haptolina brevifila TaxID=156173 RepID=A0A7S2MRQ9_9EUKA|mmetsp:Transcript_5724/g.11994  ORF Transcript_5724/g.11994 Transcript_5724/m.11994 type:complete len:309 (+) Transcript_5724:77-1003(+)